MFFYKTYHVDPKPLVFVFDFDEKYVTGFNLNYLKQLSLNPNKKDKLIRMDDSSILKYLENPETTKRKVLNILSNFRNEFYDKKPGSIDLKDYYNYLKRTYPFFIKSFRKYIINNITNPLEIIIL